MKKYIQSFFRLRKRTFVFLVFLSSFLFSVSPSQAEPQNVKALQDIDEINSEVEDSEVIAQSSLPEYLCQAGVEQTNNSPPAANYRSSVTCSIGTPARLRISVYQANVNFPSQLRYIGDNIFTCSGGYSCTSPNYQQLIDRTKILYVSVSVDVRGRTGTYYVDGRRGSVTRVYNNSGVMYPQIKPTRTDMSIIPFPAPPFSPCCSRSNSFRSNLTSLYQSRGWTIPPSAEAHHIKPIAWGGNNETYNGVFLGSTTHRLFTNWWLQFSNLNW